MIPKKSCEPRVDRRVRRTQRQLREALIALTLERGWDEVSVQDVCVRADVGRSTFYVHFADKEELLLSGFEELHAALDELRSSSQENFGFVEALIEHAGHNRRLFRAIVGKKSGQHMMRRFRELVVRLVETEIENHGIDREQRASAARYIGGGFVELLTAWLDRPSGTDPQTLARTVRQLSSGVLSAARVDVRRRY